MVTLDRDKLAKVCGMLSSSYESERAVAAERATNILKRAGMTWDDLVRGVAESHRATPRPGGPGRRPAEYEPAKQRRRVWEDYVVSAILYRLHKKRSQLTEWEENFLSSLSEQLETHNGCTSKQWVILKRIARKNNALD